MIKDHPMKIPCPHAWNVTYHEAVALQNRLRENLVLHDEDPSAPIRTVAGADISYNRRSDRFFAAIIVLSYPEMTVLEEATAVETVSFPYIPGLLSFREGPPLLAAVEELTCLPDAMIFDGQGIAHPRGIGLASHMGLILDIPTIGCAKSVLVGRHEEPGEERGAWTPLIHQDQAVGAALRTKNGINPVFISQGHKIGLERSLDIVLNCCRGYRLPEPTRQAHLAVNRLRTASIHV